MFKYIVYLLICIEKKQLLSQMIAIAGLMWPSKLVVTITILTLSLWHDICGHIVVWKSTAGHGPLARYVKLRVVHAPGMPETISPLSRVSDSDMHHRTCVTHVPWYIPGLLIMGFLWSRWRGKRSRHSRCICNSQIYVSGKRPMQCCISEAAICALAGRTAPHCVAYWMSMMPIWINQQNHESLLCTYGYYTIQANIMINT